jgi:hypothetical protein
MANDRTIKADAVGDAVRLDIRLPTGGCSLVLNVTDALLLIDQLIQATSDVADNVGGKRT